MVKKTGLPRRTVILSKFIVVSSFEEWSILEVDAGQTFLRADSFSLGYTLFSAGGMAQGGEWSRLKKIRIVTLPCLRRIVQIAHH